MLSRVANNLIWMNRYMERGYSVLNLLKVNYSAHQDSPDLFPWTPIINNYCGSDSGFSSENSIECINHMIFNLDNQNSIINLVTRSRENARSVQEHIPRELWLGINSYYLYLTKPELPNKLYQEDPVVFLDRLLNHQLLYYGKIDITQERGSAYYFMDIGKFLERVIQISDLASMKLKEIAKTSDALERSFLWKNFLLSIGAYQLYLKKYKSTFQEDFIIKLIFQEQLFPKSLYYCVNKLSRHINQLIQTNELVNNDLEFLLGKLQSTIQYTTIESINEQGLTNFIASIKNDITNISLSINNVYFSNQS
ncbi:alpha-E domain-containing protein [Seonamhaeicola aphaedonensis]|uniref:Putative alpha-E superfamily protein n=1 Tax=Seonamhaeicola aphaedonensis TaxID=1461338 RepID=A0A3D9HLR3_9FLAO|nr:alpha-E domain-containing protein [Seonamhaeicola aphaedonensis]RED50261.1 putative alpha-E superfamily protein [Seonamhaeicola aphaedonensis]